jgi:cytochrome c biogenesis protein CcmG/thiol:disulfide interchange protein DsbE
MKRKWLLWLPLGAYVVFLGIASLGLKRDQQQVIMSKMIGKPIPGMDMPAGSSSNPTFSSKTLADGKVRLVNIFASWCVPCVAEVPQLAQLQQRGVVIEGIAIRDARPDVDRFLERHGNPYDRIGLDARSTMQFYLGSSGVPESYVVDGKGVIRYQHWGPIMPQDMDTILGKLREAAS